MKLILLTLFSVSHCHLHRFFTNLSSCLASASGCSIFILIMIAVNKLYTTTSPNMIKQTLKCGTRQDKGRRCQNVPLAGVNMRSCVTSLQLVNEKLPVGGPTLQGFLLRNYDWLVVAGVSCEHQ